MKYSNTTDPSNSKITWEKHYGTFVKKMRFN